MANPEACSGEEKTNHQILPDNSNVGMIVHKGCIRKGMLRSSLHWPFSEFDKNANVFLSYNRVERVRFFYRILGCYVLTIFTAPSLITP
jgi:hypothetical protein